MATQEEVKAAVAECLTRIGQDLKIVFKEFEIEAHTGGKYRSGTWTYKFARNRVSLEYWFSAFSSRKEETNVTYQTDGDAAKLEADLRKCLDTVRDAVKRKKGMF
ncbi:MAG TPA: hypothetical protein VIL74_04725 [Pyrinomonadaceae bacterium]